MHYPDRNKLAQRKSSNSKCCSMYNPFAPTDVPNEFWYVSPGVSRCRIDRGVGKVCYCQRTSCLPNMSHRRTAAPSLAVGSTQLCKGDMQSMAHGTLRRQMHSRFQWLEQKITVPLFCKRGADVCKHGGLDHTTSKGTLKCTHSA